MESGVSEKRVLRTGGWATAALKLGEEGVRPLYPFPKEALFGVGGSRSI